MEEDKKIYRYSDEISFRKCSLSDAENSISIGDCTNFYTTERNWITYYCCNQDGLHFHCTKHPSIEFEERRTEYGETYFLCKKCNKEILIDNLRTLKMNCRKLLNIEKFKNAKFIRLDDWYFPEIKEKIRDEKISDYWIETDIKTDKDGDTIIVLYIGKKGEKDKCQFFIKPEKLQLASDHKDLDPAKILSKIEVTLKDRKLIQEYEKQ